MNTLKYLLLCAVTIALPSCKDEKISELPMGAINITNAVIGGTTVKMGTYLRDSAMVNNYRRFSFVSGNTEFRVFPTNSPSTQYFNKTIQTNEGEWYSLFLTGTAPNVESVFIKETLPAFKSEQCAIKVVNLSPNGAGLNVTLSATPTVNEFENLAYKQVTNYKTYAIPFTATSANFTFQVRDASGANVLATLALNDLNGLRYDSATIVIRGMVGGTGASSLGLLYVPSY